MEEKRRGDHLCRDLLIKIAIALLLSISGGCRADKNHDFEKLRELNVILVTVDTLRADHVGAYGGVARTPNMDRLADEGVVFEHCIAQTPLTLPSHTTILSGTYPLHHGVRDNGGFVVPDELELVSETLKKRGLETSAFIAAYVLHSKWGLAQGFDTYADNFDRARYKGLFLQNEKRADEVLESAKKWLREQKDTHFFSWIHLFDPHTPYDPPPPFDKHVGEPYRGEVEYTDHALGELFSFLKEVDLYDKSLIILTGDHGEGLGHHGEAEHGFFVYEPTVSVPLIIRAPFEFPIQRVREIVEHVNLVPTILEALDVPSGFSQGHSLLGLMFGTSEDNDPVAYTETFYPRLHYGWSELRALYHQDLKLIDAPEIELFRMSNDEKELTNLSTNPSFNPQKQAIREKLRDFMDSKVGKCSRDLDGLPEP